MIRTARIFVVASVIFSPTTAAWAQRTDTRVAQSAYDSPSAPLPIIKNEELILLRAEANYHVGNGPAALADVNVVRQESGGLPPIPAYPGDDAMLDEILYNRRYSLLWEGAHRWIDARRYGRLAQLPRYAPDHVIFPYAPLPEAECSEGLRSPVPAGCAIPEAL